MIKTKQITLSLFLSGTMAAELNKLGPVPVLATLATYDNQMYLVNDIYTLTTDALKVSIGEQAQSATVATPQATGLYACVTGGYVGLATQKIAGTATAGITKGTLVVGNRSAASPRAFYQTTIAHVGVQPRFVAKADIATATTSMISFITSVNDGTGVVAKMALVTGDFFECCPVNAASLIAGTTNGLCLTKVTYQSTTADADLDVANVSDIANRIFVSPTKTSTPTPLSADQEIYKYEPDFILGALSQISDETTAANNWCTGVFKKTTALAAATLSADNGFGGKTKCTWQLTSTAKTNAPQFRVKAAGTRRFWIQWIEASTAAVTTGIIIPAATANSPIGAYPSGDGLFFNPFVLAPVADLLATALYKVAGSAQLSDQTKSLYYPAGIPGSTKLYLPKGTSATQTHFLVTAPTGGDLLTSGVAASGFYTAQSLYTGYTTAVTSFNTLATTYNTALTAYDTAVAANTAAASLPTVPVRPCPPTALAAYPNVVVEKSTTIAATKTSRDADAVLAARNDKAIFYNTHIQGDIATGITAASDSGRFGHVYPDPDTSVTADAVYAEATTYAGHVFGRLGQGPMNMPGTMKPWRWDTTNALMNTMQVSIFPSHGSGFVTLVAGKTIDIEVSEAVIATDPFTLPSAVGVPTQVVLKLTSATALALSAVAMTVAAAALY